MVWSIEKGNQFYLERSEKDLKNESPLNGALKVFNKQGKEVFWTWSVSERHRGVHGGKEQRVADSTRG